MLYFPALSPPGTRRKGASLALTIESEAEAAADSVFASSNDDGFFWRLNAPGFAQLDLQVYVVYSLHSGPRVPGRRRHSVSAGECARVSIRESWP
jgi:hypothetical protein